MRTEPPAQVSAANRYLIGSAPEKLTATEMMGRLPHNEIERMMQVRTASAYSRLLQMRACRRPRVAQRKCACLAVTRLDRWYERGPSRVRVPGYALALAGGGGGVRKQEQEREIVSEPG